MPKITAEPEGGADVDISALLRDIDRRLSQHPHHPDDRRIQETRIELHHLLSLARYWLHDPDGARAARARKEQHHPCLAQQRALEPTPRWTSRSPNPTDSAAPDSTTPMLARARARIPCTSASGTEPAAQWTVCPPKPHNLLASAQLPAQARAQIDG